MPCYMPWNLNARLPGAEAALCCLHCTCLCCTSASIHSREAQTRCHNHTLTGNKHACTWPEGRQRIGAYL